MKIFTCLTAIIAISAEACMSDAACSDACCYMNECVPQSNIGCSGRRIDFHKLVWSNKTKEERRVLTGQIRYDSAKAVQCDKAGVYCLDFVTEAAMEYGALERLSKNVKGTSEGH